MNFEDLEIIWRDEHSQASHTIDDEALRRIVMERAHNHQRRMLWRDVSEIGMDVFVVLLLIGTALWAQESGEPFDYLQMAPLILTALGYAFVASFRFISRERQKRREEKFDDSIHGNLQKLVARADYQIRLKRRFAWWYMLPIIPGFMLITRSAAEDSPVFFQWVIGAIMCLIFWGMDWGNKRQIRTELEPQKKELESLLAGLENGGKSAEIRLASPPARAVPLSRRLLGLSLAILLFGLGAWLAFAIRHPDDDSIGRWLLERFVPGGSKPVSEHGYARVAPFTDVRWENDRPIIRVGDEWSPLVSIDGIPMDRLMAFARKEFGSRARKRFAEDLPELLSKMGHDPKWDVTLELQTKDGQTESVQVRMTERNRDLVRDRSRE